MQTSAVTVSIGETLILMPTRTVYWERTQTLFAASIRLDNNPVRSNTALQRLTSASHAVKPKRIIMLGDWFTADCSAPPDLLMSLVAADIRLHQIGGTPSHLGERLGVEYAPGPTRGPNFVLSDAAAVTDTGYMLAPGNRPAQFRGERLACFCVGHRLMTLPGLADDLSGVLLLPETNDTVYAISDDKVFPVDAP